MLSVTEVAFAMVRIGEVVPDFELNGLHRGQEISFKLSERRGKWVVLLFYPADFSFVCPTELAEAADLHPQFKKLNAELASVSMDTVFVHKAWMDRSPSIQKIEYPMLSDTTGKICRMFEAFADAESLPLRGSFIIDPQGVLRASEINDNRVGRNMNELLRKLQACVYVSTHANYVCPASWTPADKAIKTDLKLVGEI